MRFQASKENGSIIEVFLEVDGVECCIAEIQPQQWEYVILLHTDILSVGEMQEITDYIKSLIKSQ